MLIFIQDNEKKSLTTNIPLSQGELEHGELVAAAPVQDGTDRAAGQQRHPAVLQCVVLLSLVTKSGRIVFGLEMTTDPIPNKKNGLKYFLMCNTKYNDL